MDKLNFLRKELDDMLDSDKPYDEIVKKSKEIDYYITKEMLKMHKKDVKHFKIEY